MRRVGVRELRCELRLAQETPSRNLVAPPLVQYLDHHSALEPQLLAAVHGPVTAPPDLLSKDELPQHAPGEIAIPRQFLVGDELGRFICGDDAVDAN